MVTYPRLEKYEFSNLSRVSEFVKWFLKEDPYLKGQKHPLIDEIFRSGCRPNLNIDLLEECERTNLTGIDDIFISKIFYTLNKIVGFEKLVFGSYIDKLASRSIVPLEIIYKISEQYKINIAKPNIGEITNILDSGMFMQALLDEYFNVVEMHILTYLFQYNFNDYYKYETPKKITTPIFGTPKVHVDKFIEYFLFNFPIIKSKEDINTEWKNSIVNITSERHHQLGALGLKHVFSGLPGQTNYFYNLTTTDKIRGEFSVDFLYSIETGSRILTNRLVNFRLQLFDNNRNEREFSHLKNKLATNFNLILGRPFREDTQIPRVYDFYLNKKTIGVWGLNHIDDTYYVAIICDKNQDGLDWISICISQM